MMEQNRDYLEDNLLSSNNFSEEEKYLRARKKLDKIIGFYWHLAVYILVNLFIIGTIAFASEGEPFFNFGTFSTAIFWGIGLVFHWMGVYGSDLVFGKKWEEEKLKKILEEENKLWD